MPSVTASGKAWCSPVAGLVSGTAEDVEFEPRVAADGKPLSGHNFRKLLTDNGVQPLDKHETGDPSGRAWTESGDLDHYGHEHGVRLARDVDAQLAAVVERVQELRDAGWRRVRIVTDHGWLLVPGGLPKTELPKHQAETRWGRCAVLKDTAHGTPLTFGWDWCKDVQVAYAPGVSSFIAGADYAHGGLSLQECLVPVLDLVVAAPAAAAQVTIKAVTWKGLRCVVEVDSSVGRPDGGRADEARAGDVQPGGQREAPGGRQGQRGGGRRRQPGRSGRGRAFEGYVVRKDLVRTFSRQFPVPTYVVEFLLGRYCATTDEAEIQEGWRSSSAAGVRTVKAGEEELFKARHARAGSVKIIDLVTARLDAKTDSYIAELAQPAPATCASRPRWSRSTSAC
jgi:hypothetical protein